MASDPFKKLSIPTIFKIFMRRLLCIVHTSESVATHSYIFSYVLQGLSSTLYHGVVGVAGCNDDTSALEQLGTIPFALDLFLAS